MQLSRFFSLNEMIRSETAAQEGIANEPGPSEIERLRSLCAAVLDPLRESLGLAVKVNSGYRSPALNRRIGGARSSQHVEGKATDIQAPGLTVLGLFQSVIRLGLPFDQVIYEAKNATAKWVHVSHNPGANRGEIRLAEFDPDGRPRAYPLVTAQQALAMREMESHVADPSGELEYFEMGDEPSALPAVPKKRRKARARKAMQPKGKSGGRARPSAAGRPAARAAARGAAKARPTKRASARAQSSAATSEKRAARGDKAKRPIRRR